MRINTDGKKAYRNDLYEQTADVFGEATKTGGIDSACIHARQDIEAKTEVIAYLSQRLPAGELEEVAEMLSTDELVVSVDLEMDVESTQ